MKPLPPDRERELIRLADQVNALDLTGLNPIQGMVKVMATLLKSDPLMNWDDAKTVFALAQQRDPRSSFATSRKSWRGVKLKKLTTRDQPGGGMIIEAAVDARNGPARRRPPRRARVRH